MKLIGNLKKQVESENTREGIREAIKNAGMFLANEEFDKAKGRNGSCGNHGIITHEI